jgi:predicted O-methyltransferase YrrM
MGQEQWGAVDRYLADLLLAPDPALEDALAAGAAAGLPAHDVSPLQGMLLEVLARAVGARAILELGTLAGYSTIWLARALPDGGRLVTLEADPGFAEVARANVAGAGLADVVDVRVGRALDTLPALAAEGGEPFDLIFIDADKTGYPDYFEAVLPKLSARGLIVLDNMLREGAVLDAEPDDEGTRTIRELNARLSADDRVVAVLLPVRDGMTVVRRAVG